jgi:hypothetical protein
MTPSKQRLAFIGLSDPLCVGRSASVRELIHDSLRRRPQPATRSSSLQVQVEPYRSRAQMLFSSIDSPCAFCRSSTTLSQAYTSVTLYNECPLAMPSYPASLFKLPDSDLPSASSHTDLHRTRGTDIPIYIQTDLPRAACRSSTASPSLALTLPLRHQTFLAHSVTHRLPSQLVAPPFIPLNIFPPPISSVLGPPVLILARLATSSISPRVLQPRSNFPIAHLHV